MVGSCYLRIGAIMTRIRIIGKASTLSAQLADLQKQGLVPSGPDIRDPITGLSYDQIRDIQSGEFMGPLPIRWDSRKDAHDDFLGEEK